MPQQLIRFMPGYPLTSNPSNRAGSWSTPVRVASSATAVALIAANANRIGLTIHNRSTGDMYVRCAPVATPATSSSYDRLIPAGFAYEWPPNEVPTTALNAIGVAGGNWDVSESAP